MLLQPGRSCDVSRYSMSRAVDSTVVAAFVALMVRVAEMYGARRDDILARAQIREDMLADPDGRIPFESLMVIWDILAERPGYDRLGVDLGRIPVYQQMGVLGWMLAQCATMRDAGDVLH